MNACNMTIEIGNRSFAIGNLFSPQTTTLDPWIMIGSFWSMITVPYYFGKEA
jgi:hypothetical protein